MPTHWWLLREAERASARGDEEGYRHLTTAATAIRAHTEQQSSTDDRRRLAEAVVRAVAAGSYDEAQMFALDYQQRYSPDEG